MVGITVCLTSTSARGIHLPQDQRRDVEEDPERGHDRTTLPPREAPLHQEPMMFPASVALHRTSHPHPIVYGGRYGRFRCSAANSQRLLPHTQDHAYHDRVMVEGQLYMG